MTLQCMDFFNTFISINFLKDTSIVGTQVGNKWMHACMQCSTFL